MTASSSRRGRGLLVVLLLVAGGRDAPADPIVTAPPIGKGALIAQEHCPGALGLVGEVRGIGVLGASRAAALPVYGSIKGDRPELGLARVGLIGAHACQPLAFVLRADFAELTRLDGDQWRDRPLASGDAVLDDAYVWWRPVAWTGLIAGRQKVPFSRFRQVDEALLTTGVTPFLIDRVTPHRRWGLTATGDLGSMAFAAGGYLDLAHLELRADDPMTDFVEDPSVNDRAMFAAHLEWTPRAPIGRDHQPTPTADPWWHTVRLSAGAGLLWRARDGEDRLDFSLSGQAKLTRFAAIAELILSSDGSEVLVDAAAEAGVLVTNRVLLFARADTDIALDQKAAGGGMAWFVTPDRRNKVTFYGWARRREPGEPRGDGAVAELQAAF